jgi:hypothetical protein
VNIPRVTLVAAALRGDLHSEGPGSPLRALSTASILRLALAALAIALLPAQGASADATEEAWAALVKGGSVALVRHGNAPPGHGGDPPGFKLDDCATQRNMDERGREQSRAVGEAFRKHGVRACRRDSRSHGAGPRRDHAGPGRDGRAQAEDWEGTGGRGGRQDSCDRVTNLLGGS